MATMITNSTVNLMDTSKNAAYVGVGACSITINLLTFAILFHDRVLLRRSAVITGITIADFSVGLHIFCSGLYRVVNARNLTNTTSTYSCLSVVFPLIFPFSFVSQGCFVLIGGLERMLAINTPMWFHKNWTNGKAWQIVLVTYAVVLVFVVVGAGVSVTQPDVTWACGAGSVYGVTYLIICQVWSAVGGAIGAVLTLIALCTGVYRFQKLPLLSGDFGRLRKQLQLTKSMVFVSLMDSSLVVVPNMLSALSNLGWVQFPAFVRSSNANYTFCANATAAFIALLAFSAQFRRSAIKLLRIEKLVSKARLCYESNQSQNQVQPAEIRLQQF